MANNSDNKADDRLTQLKKQKEVIEARIQSIQARNKQKDRKQDTRRKILIGSYYLDDAIKNNQMDSIKNIMDKFLTRDSDRKLFDLTLVKND